MQYVLKCRISACDDRLFLKSIALRDGRPGVTNANLQISWKASRFQCKENHPEDPDVAPTVGDARYHAIYVKKTLEWALYKAHENLSVPFDEVIRIMVFLEVDQIDYKVVDWGNEQPVEDSMVILIESNSRFRMETHRIYS